MTAVSTAAPAASSGLSPQAVADLLVEQFAGGVRGVVVEHGSATVTLDPGTWQRAARFCKSDPRLRMTFFDWMSGVDEREEGFGVVVSLYSVEHRHRVLLRMIAPGGREAPVAPSLTSIYRGANWHEREIYDMYGVEFEGHPGVLPRILTVENFEGFPLRKDFLLATREAKPWPGAKEPGEPGEASDAGGPQVVASVATPTPVSAEEKVAAARAKAESVKTEAAAARARTATAPADEGVALDQETYDRLIAEGKSDRIARAKAKAVAMRRAKSGEPTAAAPPPAETGAPAETEAGPTETAAAAPAETGAPAEAQAGATETEAAAPAETGAPAETQARATETEAAAPAADAPPTSAQPEPAGATAAPAVVAGPSAGEVGSESLAEPVRSTPEGVVPDPAPADPAPQVAITDPAPAVAPSASAASQDPAAADDLPADLDPSAHDLDTYRSQIAAGKSDRQARAKAKAAKLRAARSGGDVAGAAAAATAANAGAFDPATPEGAAQVAAEDSADPSIAMDAAAGAVGGDVREGAPGDRPGTDTPVSDPYLEARAGTGAPPVPGGSPGPESEGRRTGAVAQSGLRPAATTPGMTSDADTAPERGQGGSRPNETPAPGPESDVPGRPISPADEPEIRPAPGAAEAPLAGEGGSGGPEATTTQDTEQPASAPGTGAADRSGPTYPAAGEPDAEPGRDDADDQRGSS